MTDVSDLPSPANKIVADFVDKVSGIEPMFIDGIYLTGSLPMKDFYANKSDIDFLVLCKYLPDTTIASQLAQIHTTIAKKYFKPTLSGTYLALDSLESNDPEEIKTLNYHEGSMHYEPFDMAPIILSELKTNAYTILGREAETLPIDIQESDLQDFLHRNMNSYWTSWINKHSSVLGRKLLLLFFPRLTEWAVLGVARQLCTLQTGKIVSKTEAGVYCLQQLPEQFHPILNKAIEIRKDKRIYPVMKLSAIKPSLSRYTETITCMKYMVALFNKTYNDKRL